MTSRKSGKRGAEWLTLRIFRENNLNVTLLRPSNSTSWTQGEDKHGSMIIIEFLTSRRGNQAPVTRSSMTHGHWEITPSKHCQSGSTLIPGSCPEHVRIKETSRSSSPPNSPKAFIMLALGLRAPQATGNPEDMRNLKYFYTQYHTQMYSINPVQERERERERESLNIKAAPALELWPLLDHLGIENHSVI